MYRRMRTTPVFVLLLSLSFWAGQPAWAALDCTQPAIQGAAPLDTTIVSATPVVAPVAYCNISGYVTTSDPGPNQVNFQLGLPTLWNGRFLFVDNGGYAGSFASAHIPVVAGVSAGFATAIADTGHQGAGVFGGSWALNELAKQVDFQVRAVHVSTVVSKAIIHAFYGQAGVALFFSCSTGGRQALVEACPVPIP